MRQKWPALPRRYGYMTVAVTLVAAVSLFGAVGCSSSNNSDPVSAPAGGADSGQVAAAKAQVQQLLQAPTSIGVTDPLKTAPQGGKTLVFLSCENALCQVLAKATGEAASAAGLGYKNQPITLANPATLVAGMNDVLQMNPKPAGVAFAGIPEAVWGSEVPAFEAAGIPMMPIAVGDTSTSPALPAGSLDNSADAAAQATAVANFFIADSGGTGKSLIVNVPDVGSLKTLTAQFESTVKSGCSGCTADALDVTLAQVASNGVVPAVVSALQRNPGIKYVVSPQGEFTEGLQAAVAAAGLPQVKLIGANPAEFNQQELLSGQSSAFASLPFHIMGWQVVDVALRYAEGMTVAPGDGPLPLQLLTKDTVGTPQASIDRPDNYADQFKKLWHIP